MYKIKYLSGFVVISFIAVTLTGCSSQIKEKPTNASVNLQSSQSTQYAQTEKNMENEISKLQQQIEQLQKNQSTQNAQAEKNFKNEISGLQRQIEQLLSALAPTTPKEAVEIFAKGVKSRNGPEQYAALSTELREIKRKDYESMGWVTGTSSPWVEKYEIFNETKVDEETWTFEINFELATSAGKGVHKDKLTVKKYKNNWYISDMSDPKK